MWRAGERHRELHLEVHLCYRKIVNISKTRTNECEKRIVFIFFSFNFSYCVT